ARGLTKCLTESWSSIRSRLRIEEFVFIRMRLLSLRNVKIRSECGPEGCAKVLPARRDANDTLVSGYSFTENPKNRRLAGKNIWFNFTFDLYLELVFRNSI